VSERVSIFIWVSAALVVAFLLAGLGYIQGWRTGFDTKTLWDWMELLIIPLVLAIGGFFFSRAERDAERKSADDRNQEATLQNYC
jgi:hypothetical protein